MKLIIFIFNVWVERIMLIWTYVKFCFVKSNKLCNVFWHFH